MTASPISRMLRRSLAEGRHSQQRLGQDSIGAFGGIRAFQEPSGLLALTRAACPAVYRFQALPYDQGHHHEACDRISPPPAEPRVQAESREKDC